MIKTTIVLIRHGETGMNVGNVFRGRMDATLTDNGIRQAEQLAEALKTYRLDVVYSSPLTRALETADRVAKAQGLGCCSLEAFNNIDLGDWQGRPKEEIKHDYPELWRQWITSPETITIPGGESLARIGKRIRKGLALILERHKNGTVAVVSHRSVLKITMAEILGLEKNFFWKFYFDNGSYSVVEYEPVLGYTITRLNENCHLTEKTIEQF